MEQNYAQDRSARTVSPRSPMYAAPTQSVQAPPTRPPVNDVRYGPGVPPVPPVPNGPVSPVSPVGLTAEQVWRTGQSPQPPRRPRRLRRLAGPMLTIALLAASGVVLFLRFYHAPFAVTGVAISQAVPVSCAVEVTGQISTNGAAGTVSYQWLTQPGRQPPRPAAQSVTAGQHVVYVTSDVVGSGHGSAAVKVTLQVLGPGEKAVSTVVTVHC